MLRIFPEEKWPLIDTLSLSFLDFPRDKILIRKVLAHKPLLKKLVIYPPSPPMRRHETAKATGCVMLEEDSDDVVEKNSDRETDDGHMIKDRDPKLKFYDLLRQLLEDCKNSLKILSVACPSPPLFQFHSAALKNLARLELCSSFENSQTFWEFISSINYEKFTPKLQELAIELSINTWRRNHSPTYPEMKEWPQQTMHGYASVVRHVCNVQRLVLDLRVRKINMKLIKAAFPAVSILQLNLHQSPMLRGSWKHLCVDHALVRTSKNTMTRKMSGP